MEEKVIKALDGLKNLTLNSVISSSTLRKEKMTMCVQLADQIATVRPGAQNLSDLTTRAVESLIRLCDDADADVRTVADESLNRIIRASNDRQIYRILVDLFKEIRNNGPARCIRSALTKFAALCDRTRQAKGRVFAVNLTPCILNITRRSEESVHETLASAMGQIFPVLGVFTNDNEVKSLIKSCLITLSSESAVIRRSSASVITTLLEHCRKPHVFFSFTLNSLLDVVVPVSSELSTHHILGIFGCLRSILPLLPSSECGRQLMRKNSDFEEPSSFTDKLLQIYELCLHYLGHKDHNVITASLELLNLLLAKPGRDLRAALTHSGGIVRSYIHVPRQPSRIWSRSASEMSVAMSLPSGEDSLFDDFDEPFHTFTQAELHTSRDLSSHPETRPRFKSVEDEAELDSDTESEAVSLVFTDVKDDPRIPIPKKEENDGGREPSHDDLLSLSLSDPVEYKELDVGCFTDAAMPLVFCCRRLASFLLEGTPGKLSKDRRVRISVKSLVLSGLSSAVQLSPNILTLKLTPYSDCEQSISDVLLFSSHGDPQLRGSVCLLTGSYINSLLLANQGQRIPLLETENSPLHIANLLNILEKGLHDSSPATSRLALLGIKECFHLLIISEYSKEAIPLLNVLPPIAKDAYWLNQIRLVELLTELNFTVVNEVVGQCKLQNDVENVILCLITSEDARVRTAAAEGLVKVLPRLSYTDCEYVAYSRQFAEDLKNILQPGRTCLLPKDLNLFSPYSLLLEPTNVDHFVESNLSRIVSTLSQRLVLADNKFDMFGYLEAFAVLSERYPPVTYQGGWFCRKESLSTSQLPLLVTLVSSCPFLVDLSAQCHAITVIGQLYAGLALSALKTTEDIPESHWTVFSNEQMNTISDDILTHLLKLLNIYTQIQETPLLMMKGAGGAIMHFLPSKKTGPDKDDAAAPHRQNPHYLRLHQAVKSAHANYKTSLDITASGNFLNLLEAILATLSTLLEMSTARGSDRTAGEILSYLRSVFSLRPHASIVCAIQLFKSQFSVNLPNYWTDTELQMDLGSNSLFCYFVRLPLEYMQERVRRRISSISSANKSPSASSSPAKQKMSMLKSLDHASLAAHVRQLEPMVIQAMQIYTITSDVTLQVLVLKMLSQLIQLKVKYCLLDAEQIFITFVKKQFDSIERGEIRGVEILLPSIFRFFVLLSYQKQHTKSPMSIPDILQLFVGLTASEQSKATHCVPGLKPVVEDVFQQRVQAVEDKKESETQREVLLNMLLRLAQYDQVLEALCDFVRADDQVASQVMDVVMSMLSRRRISVEYLSGYRAFSKLMAVIPANALRQSQAFIRALFSDPPSKDTVKDMARWLSGLTILVESILDLKEDTVLSGIRSLIHPVDLRAFLSSPVTSADPLLIFVPSPSIPPAESLARLLLLAASRSAVAILNDPWDSTMLQNALSIYLTTLLHLLMSGTFHEVTKSFEVLLADEIGTVRAINELFLNLRLIRPTLTCQYLNILAQLNYTDQLFWKVVLQEHRGFSAGLIQRCAVLALADYLCECTRDMETIEFFLTNAIDQIILLSSESPIREFLSLALQRPEICVILLKTLWTYQPKPPALIEKTLRLLEVVDMDHAGAVVSLLVAKFLRLPFVALSRLASGIACRRFEYFLTLPHSDVLAHLPSDDFRVIFISMLEDTWSHRHEALSTLISKLNKDVYKEPDPRCDPSINNNLSLGSLMDEEWYFHQVKQRCCNDTYRGCDIGRLLGKLNLGYVRQILADQNFRNSLLTECFRAVKPVNDDARGSNMNNIPLFIAARECLQNRVKFALNELESQAVSEHHLTYIPAMTAFLDVLPPSFVDCNKDLDCIIRLFVHCEKHIEDLITKETKSVSPHTLEVFLSCACSILMHKEAQAWFSAPENVQSLNFTLRTIQKIQISLVPDGRGNTDSNEDQYLNSMVMFVVNEEHVVPSYLQSLLRKSIILLCRIPSLSDVALAIPDAGDLQDLECLRQFIARFCALGWVKRQQFEQIWAALLGVLGLNADSPESSAFVLQASIVSLEGIGMLLESTLLNPFCGNPVVSEMAHYGRDLTCLRECGAGLPRLPGYTKFHCNLETIGVLQSYVPGLLSMEYVCSAIQQSTVELPEITAQRQTLADLGVDLTSCLQFLLDVFSQWKNEPQDQHLLATALKVSLVLSDVFTDPNQFRTLLDVVLDIDTCLASSDVPLLPLCIVVTAKCCAAILPGRERYERLSQMLCRSDSPPVRLARLQGLLYLVEAPVVYWYLNKPTVHFGNSMFFLEDNQTITNLVDSFVPLAVQYMLQFTNDRWSWSETYEANAWALLVYLIQHYRKELTDNKDTFIEFLLSALKEQTTSTLIQNIILFGVERLLLTDCLDEKQTNGVLVIAMHLLGLPNTTSRSHGLQLLLTISYIRKRKFEKKPSLEDEPEVLMAGMERISALLDRLKHSPPAEAESVGKVLGYVLQDFGAFDVLTKLIQGFLSPHHPHPHILSSLLFQVLEDADLPLLQDWVVLSLPSLTHGVPVQTSTRTLTCLFLSACRDHWLRALFPLVKDRRRCLQPEDRSLLCISATHFYSQLQSQKQKDEFCSVFTSAAKTNPLCQQIIDSLSSLSEETC